VLLGPPGSGKGTLASQLQESLGLEHLSTGEIFRHEVKRKTALGRQVERFVSHGQLVPDELVVAVMTKRLTPARRRRGCVLDGFPRTVGQAQGLEKFLRQRGTSLTGVIALTCPAARLIVRLSGRQICGTCDAIYHVRRMPPKRKGVCDRCGGALTVRKDDQLKTIRRRLRVDRAESAPLMAYYRRGKLLHRVDGRGSSEQALARTMALLRREGWVRPGPQGRLAAEARVLANQDSSVNGASRSFGRRGG
jgi:adenylate kinase